MQEKRVRSRFSAALNRINCISMDTNEPTLIIAFYFIAWIVEAYILAQLEHDIAREFVTR